MSDDAQPLFTTREVAQAAGVSIRQLQWWDQRGYLRPICRIQNRFRRQVRYYDEAQRNFARLVGILRRAGKPLPEALATASRMKAGQLETVILLDEPTMIGAALVIPCPKKPRRF